MPSENSAATAATGHAAAAVPTGNKGAASPNGAVSPGCDAKSPTTTSFDPTEYVQKQRVTKTAPPKPAYNPLQFIQIKPCNLYQSAQDQLRKAEEVKKSKITKKEEAEDWQGNLDSWKSSRRKRVEHIIERVVEVKKLEIEEHDRTRKKSKTFSEMMEERGTGGRRKISLPVYAEDESNDLSDLGIGTSSASGKSSMSEDFDNHSVISDNPDTEKSSDIDPHEQQRNRTGNGNELSYRENISSPGYETSSSTAPTTSPDPLDYPSYDATHQRYSTKQRGVVNKNGSKESTPEMGNGEPNKFIAKRPSVTKIEDRLVNFELKSSTSEPIENMGNGHAKRDLPKVDITKRREMFEKDMTPERANRSSGDFSQATPLLSIKERLCNLERQKEEGNNSAIVASNRLSGDITSIKDRLKNLEIDNSQSMATAATPPKFDIPLGGSIKDRLSSLHSSVSTTTTMTVPGAVAEVSEQQHAASPKSVVVVGMAKKLQGADTATDQVIEVETLKIEIEQIQISAGPTLSMPSQPESLMTMDSIQDAVQEYVTIAQDVKLTGSPSIREKEEYREITDEDLFGGTDIEDMEIDNLQQDMSVLEALDIAFEAIDKDGNSDEVPILLQPENECQTVSNTSNNFSPVKRTHSDGAATAADAASIASTNFDQLILNDCSNSANTNRNMDDDRDIEQFIDDLIKQSNGGQVAAQDVTERDAAESLQVEATIKPVIEEKRINFDAVVEPIYEVVEDVSQPKPLKSALKSPSKKKEKRQPSIKDESIAPNGESYYDEVPLRNPIPLYENVDIFLASVNETNQGEMLSTIPAGVNLQPPKVKPPPPPIESELDSDGEDEVDEETCDDDAENATPEENLKRMNSTKRIKKDIRNKRSSFLGIESAQDELELKLSVAPPPDMSALIEEERRLEKQFLRTYDGIVERSDSGVSESHSRQSSEPFTGSSEDAQEDRSKELEEDVVVAAAGRQGEWCDEVRMQNIEEQIREQEEVLRVERELLQIEQEELKRQRANLLLRENYARKELTMSHASLQDINQNMAISAHLPSHQASSSTSSSTTSSTFNVTSPIAYSEQPGQQMPVDYRQSMPDLQSSAFRANGNVGVTPPAKPSRQLGGYASSSTASGLNGYPTNDYQNTLFAHNNKAPSANDVCEDFVQLRRDHSGNNQQNQQQQIGNMSRHTLHALSAVPKPKLTDVWVQQQAVGRKSETIVANGTANSNKYFPIQRKAPITAQERLAGEPWIARKSDAPKGLGYGKHWLIQEAEQRRLDQQRGVRPPPNPQNWPIKSAGNLHRKSMPDISGEKKPLPDAVINTITQRLQSRMSVGNVVDRKRFDANPAIINSNASLDDGPMADLGDLRIRSQEQVLSVSGKKKCSHCDEELGRGAAMIVESLRLFYHIDCFKCCVCLVRLGDGLNGTDVRVRNHKLHCQNCYSSDDGIKFSCV